MSDLLKELQKLKPQLPQTECFVPEWNRAIVLRGFTVLEGRQLRQGMGEDADNNEVLAIKTIAHAVSDGDKRPLANPDGVALIESLSELTVRKLMMAFGRISMAEDLEGNSEPGAANGSSSSDLPSPSDEPSTSSNAASAKLN